jgi:hypothetical protein
MTVSFFHLGALALAFLSAAVGMLSAHFYGNYQTAQWMLLVAIFWMLVAIHEKK